MKPSDRKWINTTLVLIFWVLAAWLLLPVFKLDRIDIDASTIKVFIYRISVGISILIVFFGKTMVDLLFPKFAGKRMPLLNTVLLSLYAFFIAGGVIYALIRMISSYMKSNSPRLPF